MIPGKRNILCIFERPAAKKHKTPVDNHVEKCSRALENRVFAKMALACG
jgi:hypothetical protein